MSAYREPELNLEHFQELLSEVEAQGKNTDCFVWLLSPSLTPGMEYQTIFGRFVFYRPEIPKDVILLVDPKDIIESTKKH